MKRPPKSKQRRPSGAHSPAGFKADPDKLFEKAEDCCRNIATLAGLLEICGRRDPADPVEARLVAYTGSLIARETRSLEQLIGDLREAR